MFTMPAEVPNNDDRASGSPSESISITHNASVGVASGSAETVNVHFANAHASPATALGVVLTTAPLGESAVGLSSSAPAFIISARPRIEPAPTPVQLALAQEVCGRSSGQSVPAPSSGTREDAITASPSAIDTQTLAVAARAPAIPARTPAITDTESRLT